MTTIRDGRWYRLLALLFALALVAAACGDDDDGGEATGGQSEDEGGGTDEPLKVAFVYVGPIGDAGWTKKHDEGRLALEEALGDQVETSYIENVPEGATSERVFEDLARQGNRLIFGTSFGYMDQMLAVAERFPDVTFMHATGFKVSENMGTYFGAAEEARYLSGIAAGKATQNGRIGYVAAFPIPEVLRGINAFTLGAQSVNPDITVQVSWTSTWFGPDIEKSAAEGLLDSGVDVIAQHQDTPAPGEAAQAAGAKWSGYNDDMSQFAPDAWLTGPVWDWGPFYIETAEQVIDGTWESEQYYGNMADGLVGLAPFGESVDQETQDQINEIAEQIKSGDFNVFTGPIRNQAGEVVVAEGATASLDELLATDYLVEGVEGDIPAS